MRTALLSAISAAALMFVAAPPALAQDAAAPEIAASTDATPVEDVSVEAAPAPRRSRFAGIRSAASNARNRVASAARGVTSVLPNGAFSVTGRDGSMLATVDPTRIQTRIIQQDSMGLASEGNNVASFDGLRLDMPETERALTEMLDKVDAGWPHERTSPVRVRVVASNDYGPETLPDGSIMIRMGLLNRAESDDEVALMLGHELSHVRLGHFADDGGFRRKRQLASALGALYSRAIQLSETRAQQSGDQFQMVIEDERRVREGQARAAETRTLINELMTLLFERTWARKQEDEADALGFDLTVQANMAAMPAAIKMYERIDADYDVRRAASDNLFEGLQFTLNRAVTEQNIDTVVAGNGGTVVDTLQAPLQRIARDRLLGMARNYFGQKHRTPEARMNGIRLYSEAAHPDMPLVDVQTVWLDRLKATDEFREATVVVDSLREAGRLRHAHDIPGAIAAMGPAQRTRRFARAPVVANTVASLHGLHGDVSEADRLYTVAHTSPDQAASAYVDHAWLMVSNRRYTRAREIIDLGKSRAAEGIDADKPFLPSMIAMAFQQDKQQEGVPLLRRCIGYEEQALTDLCTHAALGLGLRDPNKPIDLETQVQINALVRNASSQSAVGGDFDAIATGLSSLFN